MTHDEKLFLKLLPEVYSERDGDDGPLRGLLQVLSGPAEELNKNIQQLYDDLFIETCADWVVPYIGDLLGVRGLHSMSGDVGSMRAWVANTLDYRRRKGTHYAIGLLAEDVSRYGVVASEMFEQLGWNQHLDHLRDQSQFLDIRNINRLELLDSTLDTSTRTVEVRSVNKGKGKYNVPNIAVGLWRLKSYPLSGIRCTHRPGNPGQYFVDPLERDIPLFNSPELGEKSQVNEVKLPKALRRLPVYEDIEQLRDSLVTGAPYTSTYFDTQPVFAIRELGQPAIPADRIFVCNLETWQAIPAGYDLGIDPYNGRISFQVTTGHPKPIYADYSYGFVSDIGSGPYDRSESFNRMKPDLPSWYRVVSTDASLTGQQGLKLSLSDAISDWNADTSARDGLIVILDSESYVHSGVQTITIHDDSHLMIVSAQWPAPSPSPNDPRDYSLINPTDLRPTIIGSFEIQGTSLSTSKTQGRLSLSGLLVHGGIKVVNGNLGGLEIEDVTLSDLSKSLEVSGAASNRNNNLELLFKRVICPEINISTPASTLDLEDCIVEKNLNASPTPTLLNKCTIGGTVDVRTLEASDCIFNKNVNVQRSQVGCVRFCYVPQGSKVPKAFKCQPDYAIELNPTVNPDRVRSRVTPSYVSVILGQPAYRQLSNATAIEVLAGASNGCEMGAYNRELQQYRLTNLSTTLTDYMRLGMEFGFFFEN